MTSAEPPRSREAADSRLTVAAFPAAGRRRGDGRCQEAGTMAL